MQKASGREERKKEKKEESVSVRQSVELVWMLLTILLFLHLQPGKTTRKPDRCVCVCDMI